MADQDPNINVDSDDSEEYEDPPQPYYSNDNLQSGGNDNNQLDDLISVNGMAYEDVKKLKLSFGQHHKLGQCTYCLKFYNKSNNGKGGMLTFEFDSNGEGICYHCLFWLNYSMEMRSMVDGAFGKTIVEYIVECKDMHDKESCQKNTVEGGCFLCDALNEKPIEGIFGCEIFDAVKPVIEETTPVEEYSFKISI